MCVVSNIGDMGREMWPQPFQPYNPGKPFTIDIPFGAFLPLQYTGPTREQFEEFLKLLRAAKSFDTLVGLKDCEMAEKLEWIKAIAAYLGVDVKDIAP